MSGSFWSSAYRSIVSTAPVTIMAAALVLCSLHPMLSTEKKKTLAYALSEVDGGKALLKAILLRLIPVRGKRSRASHALRIIGDASFAAGFSSVALLMRD